MTWVAVAGPAGWADFVRVAQKPRQGEVVRAEGTLARAAGGGGLVPVVLAEAGAQAGFFCAPGDDPLGRNPMVRRTRL